MTISTTKPAFYFNLPTTKTFWLPLLGTIVEYYDYALYGFMAVLIGQLYFPATDPTVSLLKTYLVFAIGSFAKPLGSLLFGWVGDRWGRKVALQWTMLGIFLPTTLIGILPTYQEWGIFSPFLLLFCRFFQGIFLSGETDGVRIFLYESFLRDRPTLINCLVGLSCYIGIFLASLAVSCTPLTPDHFWWRVPFLVGGIMGAFIFILRRFLSESVDYLQFQQSISKEQYLKKISYPAFLGTILLCGSVGGLYQIFFVFLGSFLYQSLEVLSLQTVQTLTPLLLGVYMLTQIGAAWLSDRWSPKEVIFLGIYSTAILLAVLSYQLIYHCFHPSWLFGIAISSAFIATPGFNLILNKAEVGKRYRFVSLGHALGSVLLSGSAPAISLFLWQQTQWCWAPLCYAFCLCLGVVSGVKLLTSFKKDVPLATL